MQSMWGNLFATRKNKLFSISLKTFVFVLICTSWIFRSSREPSFEFLALPLWCPRACAHCLPMCACVHSLRMCVCVYVCTVCALACVERFRVTSAFLGGFFCLLYCAVVPFSSLSLSHTHIHALSLPSPSLFHTRYVQTISALLFKLIVFSQLIFLYWFNVSKNLCRPLFWDDRNLCSATNIPTRCFEAPGSVDMQC